MLLGLHHVTAFAGDAQRNLDFYTGFMGMRLVKRTVNFDDPSTYHFYFGDEWAEPGSLLTFFPWPTAPAPRSGSGQIAGASFAVSKDALSGWILRAHDEGVAISVPSIRFSEEYIELRDPAGLPIELIGTDTYVMQLHSATLHEADVARTAAFLTGVLGFSQVATEGARTRFRSNDTWDHAVIDIVATPGAQRGRLSSGMVHHVAFRVADDAAQLEWREKLKQAGVHVTRVIDRLYFRSIYFREPGGALFEIATEGPGFFVDEAELGSGLRLPPWLESVRESIERRLPAVQV